MSNQDWWSELKSRSLQPAWATDLGQDPRQKETANAEIERQNCSPLPFMLQEVNKPLRLNGNSGPEKPKEEDSHLKRSEQREPGAEAILQIVEHCSVPVSAAQCES